MGCRNEYELHEKVPVYLLTATTSKGHEFDVVIILEIYDDEWPKQLSEDIEKEKILFYVAITSEKQYLYFVASEDKLLSRFLKEMDLM